MVTPPSPDRFIGLIPLDEPNLYRLSYGDRLNRPEDLRAAVHKRFGAAAEIEEIHWMSRFLG